MRIGEETTKYVTQSADYLARCLVVIIFCPLNEGKKLFLEDVLAEGGAGPPAFIRIARSPRKGR